METRAVIFGPFPPPVHGLSAITQSFSELLSSRGHRTHCFNLAPRGLLPLLGPFWLIWMRARFGRSLESAYIGFSGGKRQLLDCVIGLIALLLGLKVFIHHHSFAYLGERRPLRLRLFGSVLSRSIHIALCDGMARRLEANYSIAADRICVISNALFVGLREDRSTPSECRERVPVLGFLGNITREKGIFDFIRLVERLNELHVPCKGVIAGPVARSISRSFEERLQAVGNLQYVGAVYGDNKARFYASVDLLIFPTQYVNEAEPVTILEAMSLGVPTISYERGCIGSLLSSRAGGLAVDDFSAMLDSVLDRLSSVVSLSPSERLRSAEATREAFDDLRGRSAIQMERLIALIFTE